MNFREFFSIFLLDLREILLDEILLLEISNRVSTAPSYSTTSANEESDYVIIFVNSAKSISYTIRILRKVFLRSK